MAKKKQDGVDEPEVLDGETADTGAEGPAVKKYAVRRKVKHNNKMYVPSGKATEPTTIELTAQQAEPLLKLGAIRE